MVQIVERKSGAQARTKRRSILGIGLLTLGLLTLVGADEGWAQRRIEFLNQGQGVKQMPPPETQTTGPTQRLTGTATVDASGRVMLGKTLVLLTQQTGVFPSQSSRGSAFDARTLNGREITVYGKRTAKGVRASLVIVSNGELGERAQLTKSDLRIAGAPDPKSLRIPSDVSPDVGELLDEAPQ